MVAFTLVLCVAAFRATDIYQLSPTTFKIVGSLITVVLVFIASVYADAHLATSVGIAGNELPAAQRAVTVMVSLVGWTMVFTYGALILYAISAFMWMGHASSSADAKQEQLDFLMLGNTKRVRKDRKEGIYLTLFIGLAFTALTPLNAVQEAAKDKRLDRWANYLTVFASFHLKEHACFPNAPEGARFGLVDADRVIAATPDTRLGYTYELKRCEQPAAK